ncbi:MAG: hypothetical protein PHO08_00085 [Methylococcales bacterium]|nr:hypothetical protein [Methylococcales bacterium]MDD5630543.1 hypothetical protein [Methylococcales bacterium]
MNFVDLYLVMQCGKVAGQLPGDGKLNGLPNENSPIRNILIMGRFSHQT